MPTDKMPGKRPDYSLLVKVLNLGSGMLALAFLGWLIDKKCHTSYTWTLIGSGVGVLYCFFEAWRAFKEN
ncbi:MAG: AtpZ/AtpI family protein [Candidatus Omnitrophica bacterium]|nr:AtpZ/AtpI family protein [Candidatus Omnitrophota bacterium]